MQSQRPDPAERVLRALFELAQLDVSAHAGNVGRALAMRVADVGRVLLVLEARGLVRADRARLTLQGLAAAARVRSLHIAKSAWFREQGPTLARTGEARLRVARSAQGA